MSEPVSDTASRPMIDEARALYELDPTEFVAARTRLTKLLKADGRRDDAAAVAKLPRPRMGEYTLNRLARDRPELIETFAAAVSAATTAQAAAIGTGDGGALRTSTAALRAATALLFDAAVVQLQRDERDGASRRDELLSIIRSITTTDSLRQLGAGVVGSAVTIDEGWFVGAPEPHEMAARPARATSTTATRRSPPPPRAKVGAAPAARSRAAKVAPTPATPTPAERAAQREAQRRHRAQVDRATRSVERAARQVIAAQAAVDDATRSLDEARASHRQALAELQLLDRQATAVPNSTPIP